MEDKELEDLRAKVDKLEYTEIKSIKEDITQIKLDLNTNNLLTKQSIDSYDKLSSMINTMRDTMIDMGQSLKDGNRISGELAETVRNLNEKVESVEDKMDDKFDEFNQRIDDINEKSKIDFLLWLKTNWLKVVLVLMGASYLITQAIGFKIF